MSSLTLLGLILLLFFCEELCDILLPFVVLMALPFSSFASDLVEGRLFNSACEFLTPLPFMEDDLFRAGDFVREGDFLSCLSLGSGLNLAGDGCGWWWVMGAG
jgi:hypothetical protein